MYTIDIYGCVDITHIHNYIVVNAEIKFSKTLEPSQKISIENIKYFPPTHFSIVRFFLIPGENSKPLQSRLWYQILPLASGQCLPQPEESNNVESGSWNKLPFDLRDSSFSIDIPFGFPGNEREP
jgi:hypothetical protein